MKVSKDTVSRWCRDIVLTKDQEQRLLQNKIFGQKKGSLIAAKNKRKARITKTKIIFRSAKKEIGHLNKRDRFLSGVALYAAEGSKGAGGFSNSDPQVIQFMMQWFREFCKLPLSKFRGALWLHDGLSERKAKKFWSTLTGIPRDQFHKTYIAENKKHSKKIRKNIHNFGIFAIRFTDTERHRRIMGWISALFYGRIPAYLNK
ncbi:MAG: hypothetical protein Q8Q92_04590 [bacterium]|nr:hypothetical protein [bacterium]